MMERRVWYVAAWSAELDRRPLGRTILGEPFVLFRSGDGRPRAIHARCAHRGADLAQGRILDGCVECPLHGWRYDGEGRCVHIPSQPRDQKTPRSARVAGWPIAEQRGILWIWPSDNAPSPPEPPAADDSGVFWAAGRTVRVRPQLLPAPVLDVVESQLDLAHVPFVHRGSFGRDVDPLVARQIVETEPNGRHLDAREDPDSPWRPAGNALSGFSALAARLLGQSDIVDQHARFELPTTVARRVEWSDGTWDRFVSFLTPADEAHTWLFYETVRTRAPHWVADHVQRWFMRKVAAEGSAESTLPLRVLPGAVPQTSVESDRVGLAALKLYSAWLKEAADAARDRLRPQ